MPPLSRQQQQQIVDALISLGWMRNQDRKSCELIREQLECSMEDAMEVLQYLHLKRNLIRAIDRSDEELLPGVLAQRYGWKWERQSDGALRHARRRPPLRRPRTAAIRGSTRMAFFTCSQMATAGTKGCSR
jgi:hypothetical protein